MVDKAVIDEIMANLEELKKELEEMGGKLPNERKNPEFYSRLQALIDTIKDEGIKMPLTDIADRLGVNYRTLVTRLYNFRKMELKELSGEEVEEVSKESKKKTKKEEPVEVISEPSGSEIEKPKVDEPISTRTAMKIMDAVKRHFGRKAEKLAKEEVEKIIAIGRKISDEYEKRCYSEGFQTIDECIDAAFTSLFDVMPEYYELQNRYDALKALAKQLLLTSNDYIRIKMIIDEMSKNLNPEDQLKILELI